MGVASYPDDAEDKEKLIYCADGALYEAKRSGKNRVKAYKKPAAA
jgi:PleD family two-component response regulator